MHSPRDSLTPSATVEGTATASAQLMATLNAASVTCSRFSNDQRDLLQFLRSELGQIRVTAKQIYPDHKLLMSPSYGKFLLDRPLQIPRSCRTWQREATLLPWQQTNANLEL